MKNNERIGIPELLDPCRKTLEPGIYFFCGKWHEGNVVGIEEVVDHYRSEELGVMNILSLFHLSDRLQGCFKQLLRNILWKNSSFRNVNCLRG